MSRFDGWEEPAEVKSIASPVVESEEKAPEVVVETKEQPKEAATKADDEKDPAAAEESEEVKGLKASAYKYREKLRQERAEKQALKDENEKLKSSKSINVDDFDSFEDYEKALEEKKRPAQKADPLVLDAIVALNKKFEKAGLDVEEMRDSLSEMKHLPDSMILALSDRKDAASIAKWLAENEETDEAQEALHARTEMGRMRYLDEIAEIVKSSGSKKAAKPNGVEPVNTITRLPGGAQPKSLDGLSPAEFEKVMGGGRNSRFDW